MSTFLNEKDAVSNVLGRTDGATANTIRDNMINEVRQSDIANAYPFSWLEKPATVTTSSGVADLPADYNINHKMRVVSDASKSYYYEINKELWVGYHDLSYVYFIDYNTSTNRWRINTKNDVVLSIIYYHIPATLTGDTDIDVIPDLKLIKYFVAAEYWLSSERDETNHDRFQVLADRRLKEMILIDKKARPQRSKRGSIYTVDMGFN
jgi:hypothetical protein